jgi:hypothetical protein
MVSLGVAGDENTVALYVFSMAAGVGSLWGVRWRHVDTALIGRHRSIDDTAGV